MEIGEKTEKKTTKQWLKLKKKIFLAVFRRA